MAENKKSVLLYCDIIYTVEELEDADAGLLFKHYLRYINDLNPEPPSKLIKIVFEPIKQNLKRDLRKWESQINQRSEAGKKGMEKRWHNKDNTVITKDNTVINPITNITDNVTVTVKDTVTVKVNDIEERRKAFAQKVKLFGGGYESEMLKQFYHYWTESNEGGKKMRFEMEKVFDIGKRLVTWNNRNKNYANTTNKKGHNIEGAVSAADKILSEFAAANNIESDK